MTETISSTAGTAAPASPNLAIRAIGVITAPRRTYAAVAEQPRVLGALLLTIGLMGAGTILFLRTEVGAQAALDQQVRQAEAFGRPINDAAYAQMERMLPYFGYIGAGSQALFITLGSLMIAGLAFAIFTAIMGGNARYKQVLAVVVHSGFILVLAAVFVLPLDYARESLTSPTTVGVLLPFLDEGTFPGRLAGSIDLFYVWWVVNLSIGLGVLYKRRTAPIAAGMLAVYFVIALAVAAIRSALAGA
jgi:hypothetical protein